MTTLQDVYRVIAICNAFLDTVQAAGPDGAPAGVMYAAVMDKMSLEQFECVMGLLVEAGRLRKSNHVYYAVEGRVL